MDKLERSIKALKMFAREKGYFPSEKEWNDYAKQKGFYVGQTIRVKTNHNWEGLRKKFGFPKKIKEFTKEDCIYFLKEAAKEYGKAIRKKEYTKWQKKHPEAPSMAQITRIFKSYQQAKIEAGLILNKSSLKFTTREIYQALLECAKVKGKLFSESDYESWRNGRKDIPSIETIRKRTGSLIEAKKQMNLDYYIKGENLNKYEEGEWQTYFFDFLKDALSQESYIKWAERNNAPSISVLYRHTGGHTKALQTMLPIYLNELEKDE